MRIAIYQAQRTINYIRVYWEFGLTIYSQIILLYAKITKSKFYFHFTLFFILSIPPSPSLNLLRYHPPTIRPVPTLSFLFFLIILFPPLFNNIPFDYIYTFIPYLSPKSSFIILYDLVSPHQPHLSFLNPNSLFPTWLSFYRFGSISIFLPIIKNNKVPLQN